MTFQKIWIALLGMALCSCVTPIKPVESPGLARISLSPGIEAAAEKAVNQNLKDPDSSKFSNLVAYQKDPHMIAVCGFVNAKNSYGGYVGATPFFAYVDVGVNGKAGLYFPGEAVIATAYEPGADPGYFFYQEFPLCAPHT